MQTETFKILLEKYLDESIEPAEKRHFSMMLENPDCRELLNATVDNELLHHTYEGEPDEKLKQLIHQHLNQQIHTPVAVHHVHLFRKTWFRYAAAILLILGAGSYLWLRQNRTSALVKESKHLSPDIAPGGNKAILTLADGSIIVLDSAANGTLAAQGNTQILKLDAGSLAYNAGAASGEILYNTIGTPKGGQYHIVLPDGTKVWLNAASSIRFPTVFTKDRKVTITGEVYMEVAKDKVKPFYVHVGDVDIQVLGTSFNINAYQDENVVSTTLVEGSIRVSALKRTHLLAPGQQAQVGVETRVIDHVDIDKALAWKNGAFCFNDADLKTVMRQLGRWYDVDIVYEGNIPVRKFRGKMGRDLNLSDVLEILKKSKVNFRIEGRKLTVMP
jgi:ferric-dicitrate binding protein FerR (iron transport regulator)